MFITFEGGEGVGKTTQIKLLADYLISQGKDVVITREPGGTPIAEEIRGILLNSKAKLTPETELMLVYAARKDHVENKIIPALKQGKYVLCDRFADSSYIYQGYLQGVDNRWIDEVHSILLGDFWPELTILLDMPIDASLTRTDARGDKNRFDNMHATLHTKIREGFKERAKANPNRIKLVNADNTAEAVFESVKKII